MSLRALAALFAILLTLAGCSEIRETEPERAANEQLLISAAADSAVEKLDFTALAGRSVYLDASYFESYDKGYALGATRAKLALDGARLAEAREDAAYVVELRSGALSLNNDRFYIGIGGFKVPIPFSDSVDIPRATFYEDYDRTAIAKFGVLIVSRADGTIVGEPRTVYGLAWIDRDTLLVHSWTDKTILPDDVEAIIRPR